MLDKIENTKKLKKELIIKINELLEIVNNLQWEITYLKTNFKKLKDNKK